MWSDVLHVFGSHMIPLVSGPHLHSTVVLSPCGMNQGGHGLVSSSLGAGTEQCLCSWSVAAINAGKQDKSTSTPHQMNIHSAAGQNIITVASTLTWWLYHEHWLLLFTERGSVPLPCYSLLAGLTKWRKIILSINHPHSTLEVPMIVNLDSYGFSVMRLHQKRRPMQNI